MFGALELQNEGSEEELECEDVKEEELGDEEDANS